MKTHSCLACVAPCFGVFDHDHLLKIAASLLSKTFYGIIKHMNNVREGIKFDKKENYETVTSTSTHFRWWWVTAIDNFFHLSASWKCGTYCKGLWKTAGDPGKTETWRKWGMEQENGEIIGAFGVFYSVDMSTWGRHFVLTDARCLRPEVTYFAGKKLKIDRSVKMPWHRLSMGVAGSKWWAPGLRLL